jgi:hypothetical protein
MLNAALKFRVFRVFSGQNRSFAFIRVDSWFCRPALRGSQTGITKEHENNARTHRDVNRPNVLHRHGSDPISNRDRQMECGGHFRGREQTRLGL